MAEIDEIELGDESATVERKLEDLRLMVRAALNDAPAVLTDEGPGYLLRTDVVGRLRELTKHVSVYEDDYDAEEEA